MKNEVTVVRSVEGNEEEVTCPRFNSCSAPICPIDPDWRERVHRKGEPVCFYLRLHSKNALWDPKSGSVPRKLARRVGELAPEIMGRYAPLKRALERAALSPQKGFTRGEQQ